MSRIAPKMLAALLVDAVDRLPVKDADDVVAEFVRMIAKEGMLPSWRAIEAAIPGAWKKKYGVASISVLSSHPLSAAAKKALAEYAPFADVAERVDNRLIGGAVVRIDDRRIDGTIAGMLTRLAQQL